MSEFWSERDQVAAKQHRCDFCGLSVAIGETYRTYVSNTCGALVVTKLHVACSDAERDIRIRLHQADDDEMLCISELETEELEWAAERTPAFRPIIGRYEAAQAERTAA